MNVVDDLLLHLVGRRPRRPGRGTCPASADARSRCRRRRQSDSPRASAAPAARARGKPRGCLHHAPFESFGSIAESPLPSDGRTVPRDAVNSGSSVRYQTVIGDRTARALSFTMRDDEEADGPSHPGAGGRKSRGVPLDSFEGPQWAAGCLGAHPGQGREPAGRPRLPAVAPSRVPEAPLIEIVFHELESTWAMELIRGVENVAKESRRERGAHRDRHPALPGRRSGSTGVLRRRPLGVVLVFSTPPGRAQAASSGRGPSRSSSSTRRATPSPTCPRWAPRTGPAASPPPAISSNSATAGSRIITGPEDMLCSLARLDGFRSAMSMAGLMADPRTDRASATSTCRAASSTPWIC